MPGVVGVEAMDEGTGFLRAEFGCVKKHDSRLIEAYGGQSEGVKGLRVLVSQIRRRARDKEPLRVIMQVRALRIVC